MLAISEKEQLKEYRLLLNKGDLTESEKERCLVLSDSLNENLFSESVLDLLDDNQELLNQILNYLAETSWNIEQIIFGGVAMGLYLLDRIYPSVKRLGVGGTPYCDDRFQAFWVEPCEFHEKMTRIVDEAIDQALEKMIADAD